MKKQFTIICIIGMLLVVGLIGCLENNKENNGNTINPLSGKVTVTTNKSEYRQNETINITLCNGLNVSIYSFIASQQEYFIEQIEKKTSEGWLVYHPLYLIDYFFAYHGEVQSGQSFSFEWSPIARRNGTLNYSQLEPGVYRIKSGYTLSGNNTWQTVYSNEFNITNENDSNYEPINIKDVVITLGRTPGSGGGPIYNLTIYGNGTVVYEGLGFVNISGKRTINISEGKIRQLISEFEKIDYFSLNDNYEHHDLTDCPDAITSLTINGRTKTIRHYLGNFTAPIELTQLEDKIDEIVNSNQWINPSYEIFTVYGYGKQPYNITVYNVSIPLNESEAIKTIEELNPSFTPKSGDGIFFNITKTENGWDILYGPFTSEVAYIINEQNGTITIYPGM